MYFLPMAYESPFPTISIPSWIPGSKLHKCFLPRLKPSLTLLSKGINQCCWVGLTVPISYLRHNKADLEISFISTIYMQNVQKKTQLWQWEKSIHVSHPSWSISYFSVFAWQVPGLSAKFPLSFPRIRLPVDTQTIIYMKTVSCFSPNFVQGSTQGNHDSQPYIKTF